MPIRLKGNLKRISGSSLRPLRALNKDISATLQTLLTGGVANGTSKNVDLGKFCQDLEISEAFVMSLEVSFFDALFLLF